MQGFFLPNGFLLNSNVSSGYHCQNVVIHCLPHGPQTKRNPELLGANDIKKTYF